MFKHSHITMQKTQCHKPPFLMVQTHPCAVISGCLSSGLATLVSLNILLGIIVPFLNQSMCKKSSVGGFNYLEK